MLVPGLVVATEKLLHETEMTKALEQVRNVATLPGIVGYSVAMPDIHWGYGFPIGGVAAMDPEEGVVSPGGVGYDINCGVRLALAPFTFDSLSPATRHKLLLALFELIPSGVGSEQKSLAALSETDYALIAQKGVHFSLEHGDGVSADLNHIESLGCIAGADTSTVSHQAKSRGKKQLGTLGSGNHFVEIGEVEQILLPEVAKAWNVELKQTYILIHSGSRGFGHQVCQDTLDDLVHRGFAKQLVDPQLACAPIKSPEGKRYLSAMATAANFAFNNRQKILSCVRKAFHRVCNTPEEEIRLLYDVCHNIAKFEQHQVEGKERTLLVHRKGATRAYGPHAKELAPIFQTTGQPVLVPGDMGRASYLLVGQGNPVTFCSACHGAGRAKSRIQSMKQFHDQDLKQIMKDRGVDVMASSFRTVAEEMPEAYKNVDLVVAAVEEAGLAKIVAKLKPKMVIKG